MRAIQADTFGEVSVLILRDVERPEPLGRDILVRVKASGVNPIEWKIRSGAMARAVGRALPVTFGWACAGIVEATRPDVTDFRAGDEICAYPEFTRGGTHADFVPIDAAQAAQNAGCWKRQLVALAIATSLLSGCATDASDVGDLMSARRRIQPGVPGAGGR